MADENTSTDKNTSTTDEKPAKKPATRTRKATPAKSKATASKSTARKSASAKTPQRKSPARKAPAAKAGASPTATRSKSAQPKAGTKAASAKATPKSSASAKAKPDSQTESAPNPKDRDDFSEDSLSLGRDILLARTCYMVMFGFLGWLATVVGLGLAVVHLILTAVRGEPNAELARLLKVLGDYVADVFAYLSFETDTKPFPLDEDD